MEETANWDRRIGQLLRGVIPRDSIPVAVVCMLMIVPEGEFRLSVSCRLSYQSQLIGFAEYL